MTPDRLLLTPEGRQAMLVAEQGGVYIRPRSFVIGDYNGSEPSQVPGSVLGNPLYTGTLHYVEVLTQSTVRFTVAVPQQLGTTSLDITEAVVYLNDGTPFGRVRFSEALRKNVNRGVRVEFMLHLTEGNAHVIDVTLSEFGSVPSVLGIDSLPSASTAITNAVVVLDLQDNPDGSTSPELAYRFGNGGSVWGFSGYSRLHSGNVSVVSQTQFTSAQTVSDFELQTGDRVIVSISAGAGAGETRRFRLDSSGAFIAVNSGFTAIDSSSALHIWKQIAGVSGGGDMLPDREGTGADWVLVAGTQATGPRWLPQGNSRTRTRGHLYHPPGKLNMQSLVITPTQSQSKFMLFNEDPLTAGVDESQMRLYSYRSNNNYAIVSLGGANQHRTAFEITNNMIEFSEAIPVDAEIDARLYELQPHTGTYTNVASNFFTGDGSTRIFDLPAEVENAHYTLVYVERILTKVPSYSIDLVNRRIIFSEPPEIGHGFEINCFNQEESEGYSTQVITTQIKITDLTNVITLPVVPQSKDHVFVSESGAHLFKREYSVVGNKVITNIDFVPGRTVEIMIFHNIRAEGTSDTGLRGMVTDALVTAKSIELIRHGAERVRLPFPEPDIREGKGIRITGTWPNLKFESTIAERIAKDKFDRIAVTNRVVDSEEIIITRRVEFSDDIMLMITADFEAKLGPGFKTTTGLEEMQYSIGFRTVGSNEPDYGRNQEGTGDAGFAVSDPSRTQITAKSNASISASYTIIAANHPAGYIDIVAKMRVIRAQVSEYGSMLRSSLNGIIIPKF